MIKALKACKFAGKNYSAGDIVPEHAVDSKALGSLAMMKILKIVEEKTKPPVEEKPKPRKTSKSKEIEVA